MLKSIVSILFIVISSVLYGQHLDDIYHNTINFYQQGRYKEAIIWAEKFVVETKREYGDNDIDYGASLIILSNLYQAMGGYEQAEPLLNEAIKIAKQQLGEDHPNYATSINNLAHLYSSIGKYKKAEPILYQVSEIYEKQLGEESPEYALSLNNLANLYYFTGRYQEAEPLLQEATNIYKKLGEDHPDYPFSVNNLALLYHKLGSYKVADSLFQQAKSIFEGQLSEDHPKYAITLNNLAVLYEDMGRYEESEALLQEAINIRSEKLGKDHPDYATSLNNLALLYKTTSRYAEAEKLYRQSIGILEKKLGVNHPYYVTSIGGLAGLYQDMSRYNEAESLFREAVVTLNTQLGKNHPDYAHALINLAGLNHLMGRYDEAEQLYLQAVKILKVQGEDHPGYASSLHNLAGLYESVGRYREAEPVLQKALGIRQEQLGENHPDYALSLNNLADLYESMGHYKQAAPLYQKAIRIFRAQLGDNHPKYATSLNNLGLLYSLMGHYEQAAPLYQKAIRIFRAQLGENHPDYATSLNNLAGVYQAKGRYEEAEPLLLQANEIIHHDLTSGFIGLSEKEKRQYLRIISNSFEAYHSFVVRRKKANPAITTLSYDNALTNKGMLLQSSQAMRSSVLQSGDSSLLKQYDEWVNLKQQLAQLYRMLIAQRYADTDSLERIANQLEKELNRKASAFRIQTRAQQATWQSVKQGLKPKEAALEFVHFRYFSDTSLTDTIYYAALLLLPQDPYPQMIKLCTQAQLDSLFAQSNSSDLAEQLYRGGRPPSGTFKGKELYELIWQPLDSLLSEVETIYFSPSGRLHQVAFAALHYGDRLLMDRYQLHQLSSTRLLAVDSIASPASVQPQTAMLLGGINYAKSSVPPDAAPTLVLEDELTTRSLLAEDVQRRNGIKELAYTKLEVEGIDTLMKTQGITTKVYTEQSASEHQLKQLVQNESSPDIIHLATHGFFFPDVEDSLQHETLLTSLNEQQQVYRMNEDPLYRAGLLLAGANPAWQGETVPLGKEDGILTAYEVSQMNLTNTELVVLSACETGLGQVQGSEGVYGLQRAFKMAGARYLIMSLWQVPDQATQQMMQWFYQFYLKDKMPIREAFRLAQEKMRHEGKYDPYAWAAFTLVE